MDGTDLSIKELKCYWYFNCFVRDGCGIELDEFVDRFGMRTFIHVDVTPKASSFDKPH